MPSVAPPGNNRDLNNTELLQRISMIESRLAAISGRRAPQSSEFQDFALPVNQSLPQLIDSGAPLFPSLSPPPDNHSTLPPAPVLWSIIDTYFEHVHGHPYSYFQEASFRHKLQSNVLPRCLVLAVLSSAVRFSKNEYFQGNTQDASEKFARESWLSVLTEHLTVEDNLNVHVVQTVNLLAVVDYTAGRVSSGWLKIGLAARISQDLHLMTEPDEWLSYVEQEERRRAFWSAYLIDKLISCGRSRPLVILDEDCNVQLPCDEKTFRNGDWRKTNTIGQLLNWNTEVIESPSPFALVILMASIFGRCTRYVHQNRRADEVPPWDPKSEFSAINSSLLLLESYSKIGNQRLSEILQNENRLNNTIDPQEVGYLVFAHTLFHLCHCLMNHPFLVRIRLKAFGSKAPTSFSARSLQVGCDHARQLMDVLRDASENGFQVESSFYAYCIAVAGGINSLVLHFEHQKSERRQSDILHYLNESLDALKRLAKLWVHAVNMAVRLQEFHNISPQFASLLDQTCLMEDVDRASQEILWSMIDYGILGADPNKKPLTPKTGISNLSSQTSWTIDSDMLGNPRSQWDGLNPKKSMRGSLPSVDTLGPFGPNSNLFYFPEGADMYICDVMGEKQPSPWNSVVSGTTAAILANVLVYPLDLSELLSFLSQSLSNNDRSVKTRLQVQVQNGELKADDENAGQNSTEHAKYNNALDAILQILRQDGVCGLYSGLESSVFGTASMNFAYFYWSAAARVLHQSILQSYGLSDSNSVVNELAVGAVGGAMAQLCTNPIAVISTRQQTRKAGEGKISMWATMKEIIQSEDGWTGLWRGFKVNLILVVNPMITYSAYQWLRGRLMPRKTELRPLDAFFLGALSKVMATIATHPLIVAKTMLQSKPTDRQKGKPLKGFIEVLVYIMRNEGTLRLYKGLAPQIIKGFLVQGLMMMLKERTEVLLILALSLSKRRIQKSSVKRALRA
ncbi:hypothetical protein N7486_000706 [Penicillium sp. IBT 16267x]|nr:hypothetical protein N7486_000706 [Penicillium sp. IBT 16267x]